MDKFKIGQKVRSLRNLRVHDNLYIHLGDIGVIDFCGHDYITINYPHWIGASFSKANCGKQFEIFSTKKKIG